MTYELWQQDDIPIMDIDLDELNPRIPGHGLAQRELIDDLIANAKVIELARAIAQKGYYPTERIIVSPDFPDGLPN